MPTIYHLSTSTTFFDRLGAGSAYAPAGWEREGFVHCSPDPETTLLVARSYFADAEGDVLVLAIETDRLTSECRFEAPAPLAGGSAHRTPGKLFPHVYGPIDRAAITGVGVLGREGLFAWPERFEPLEPAPPPLTICLFCGSSDRVSEAHKESARRFGAELARRGWSLVYGGGRVGLMGIAADAALAGGAKVTGVIPRFIAAHEVAHTGLSELVVVETMHERKALMASRAHAFVALGGGFGTLDELFEILTWRQIGLHDRPIAIVNVDGCWDALERLAGDLAKQGFVRESHLSLVHFARSVAAALDALASAPRVRGSIASKLG
jgi:uncharacterized protein (TIGR00730 family)